MTHYAILRHGKINSTSKGVAIAHNKRTGAPADNIDQSLSHLNKYWSTSNSVLDEVNKKIPSGSRKDAVQAVELILSASPDWFDGISSDLIKLRAHPKFQAWVNLSFEWAKKEFGDNLVSFDLHMDENSPHMHVLAVPLTSDGRLCAKEIVSRLEMKRRQTEYAKKVEPLGLERGESAEETKRKHTPIKAGAKALAKVTKELAAAREKIKELTRELQHTQGMLMMLPKRTKTTVETVFVENAGNPIAEKEKAATASLPSF